MGAKEKGRKRGPEVGGVEERQRGNSVFTDDFPSGTYCSLSFPPTPLGPHQA